MTTPLGAGKQSKLMAISVVPSFNYVNSKRTRVRGFTLVQTLDNAVGTAEKTTFNGQPAYLLDQTTQPTCTGDEAGWAGGVKSGTVGGEVKPTSGTSSILVEGKQLVRHGDSCTMNNGNVVGKYQAVSTERVADFDMLSDQSLYLEKENINSDISHSILSNDNKSNLANQNTISNHPSVRFSNPVINHKPTPDGIGNFGSMDDAAKDVLTKINPVSISENVEYGGYFFQRGDGSYGYGKPVKGLTSRVSTDDFAPIPKDSRLTGFYHTHGSYYLPGFNFKNTASDRFSQADINIATGYSQGKYSPYNYKIPNFKSYLGTPSGDFKIHTPSNNQISILK